MEFALMNKDTQIGLLLASRHEVRMASGELPFYIHNVDKYIEYRFGLGTTHTSALLTQAGGIKYIEDYLRLTHATSIYDTFWVKEPTNKTTWDQVNPWLHPLPRWAKGVSLGLGEKPQISELNLVTPNFTLRGPWRQSWVNWDTTIELHQNCGAMGMSKSSIKPILMCYASQVAQAYCGDTTPSRFVEYHRRQYRSRNNELIPMAVSKAFTTLEIGYVPYGFVARSGDGASINVGELIRIERECNGNIPEKDINNRLADMIIVDTLTMNTGRNGMTFGYLVANSNGRVLGPAPVRLSGDCFFGDLGFVGSGMIDHVANFKYEYHKRKPGIALTTSEKWNDTARLVMNKKIERRLMDIYPFHFKKLGGQCDVSDDRLEFMEYIVNRQIRELTSIGTLPGERRVC